MSTSPADGADVLALLALAFGVVVVDVLVEPAANVLLVVEVVALLRPRRGTVVAVVPTALATRGGVGRSEGRANMHETEESGRVGSRVVEGVPETVAAEVLAVLLVVVAVSLVKLVAVRVIATGDGGDLIEDDEPRVGVGDDGRRSGTSDEEVVAGGRELFDEDATRLMGVNLAVVDVKTLDDGHGDLVRHVPTFVASEGVDPRLELLAAVGFGEFVGLASLTRETLGAGASAGVEERPSELGGGLAAFEEGDPATRGTRKVVVVGRTRPRRATRAIGVVLQVVVDVRTVATVTISVAVAEVEVFDVDVHALVLSEKVVGANATLTPLPAT
jgi:hypothetical protein